MVAILFVLTILLLLGAEALMRRRDRDRLGQRRTPDRGPTPTADARRAEPAPPLRAPGGVFFAPGHSWLSLQESGALKLGVDDLARTIIGTIDDVVSRATGAHVRRGDVIVTLRHGDRTVDVRAPFDGVVEQVNPEFAGRRRPEPDAPLCEEWLCRIRPDDAGSALAAGRLGEAAREWLSREVDRLKVLVATARPEGQLVGATLPDGGALVWGLADHLTDEEWRTVRGRILV